MIVDSGTYFLYRHIRKDTNEVFYVGIGSKKYGKRLDKCDRAYLRTCRTKWWKNIVEKTEYEVEIILESDDENFIISKEIEFIKLYGRKDLGKGSLVNLTDGGEGTNGRKYKMSPESIEKMRKSLTGRKLSKERCLQMSKRMKGGISPMKGKKQTQYCIDRIREVNTGKIVSEETREKIRQTKIGKPVKESTYTWRFKKVDQYNLNGDFIKTWDNIRDASLFYNVGTSEICITCRAQAGVYPEKHKSYNRKTCRGFIWKYHKIEQN